ncbi:MAG: sulfatase [Rhodothermales bacterium]|nr:sulfatase [Rhodothermales bacterium]
MLRSSAVVVTLALLVASLGSGCRPAGEDPSRFNVVLIVVDDLGWMDVGSYGSALYETPAIDKLARDGIRFTQFYSASPVCSPTRASLMTGRHPARLQLTNWIGGEQNGLLNQAAYVRQLPLAERTVGEVFSEAGYATAYIGKWHLGKRGFMPTDQGFMESFAVNEAGQPGSYFPPYENPSWPVTNVPDLADDSPDAYLTDRLTDVAVNYIASHSESPFLLVLSHYAVHTPLQARDSLRAKYETLLQTRQREDETTMIEESGRAFAKSIQDNPSYAAMVESTDSSVDRVMQALGENDLLDQTIVIFVSDNGGLSTLSTKRPRTATSNLPLRAGKGWLYEGGIRIPLIIKAPGAAAGGTIDAASMTTDLLPTLADLAGIPYGADTELDGVSLGGLLRGESSTRDEASALYWHFPHYHGSGNRPSAAIRVGDYKLVEWFEDGSTELYDISADVSERTNLAEDHPERASELSADLHEWLQSVGANMATVPSTPGPQ